MYNEKEENTKLTLESYGNVYKYEAYNADTNIEDILYAFYGLLTAATWQPTTILEGMRNFADERLDYLKTYKEEDNV